MGKNKRHGEPKTNPPGQIMTNIPQSVAELVEVLTADQLGVPMGEVTPWNDAGRSADPGGSPTGGPAMPPGDSGE